MPRTIVFAPEAQSQLVELYRYLADVASPDIASDYTDDIIDFCEGMSTLPHRGTKRDDVRPGLRITNFRKRVVVAFTVSPTTVAVLGLFYGGQDYESILHEDPD